MEINDNRNHKIKEFFKNRPPSPILLICIFEILGLLLLPSSIASDKSINLGLWYQIYLYLTGGLSIAIIYTLWKMKKIGILIYIGSYAVHNVMAIIAGNWMIGVLLIPFIGLILIGLSHNKFN